MSSVSAPMVGEVGLFFPLASVLHTIRTFFYAYEKGVRRANQANGRQLYSTFGRVVLPCLVFLSISWMTKVMYV